MHTVFSFRVHHTLGCTGLVLFMFFSACRPTSQNIPTNTTSAKVDSNVPENSTPIAIDKTESEDIVDENIGQDVPQSSDQTILSPVEENRDITEPNVAVTTTDEPQVTELISPEIDSTTTVAESDSPTTSTDEGIVGNSSENAVIKPGDWAQWGGSSYRNNTPIGENVPDDWDIGEFDRRTAEWDSSTARNIKWVARVGSQTYGNPVVANGQIYIGTNNAAGYLPRYPGETDLGCLLCFRESDGEFLWQHSSEKLPTGRVHDWPLQGICCAPLVEEDRLWFVSSRGHVVCVDTEGYRDGEDDGSVQNEKARVFKQNPQLDVGLDDGTVAPSLRAVFSWNKVPLNGRIVVDTVQEGQQWILTLRTTDGKKYYSLQRQENQLNVFPLESEDAAPGDEPLFQTDDSLVGGLDQGQFSDSLAAMCADRGLKMEGERTVSVIEAGRHWKASVQLDGAQLEIIIRQQGPHLVVSKSITTVDVEEADTVWVYDMMSELGVSQHNMCSCSVTSLGDILFVNTSNGVDETHLNIPSLDAPSFIAMNKNTGEVLWTDASPGENILHGQWSSPTVGILGEVPQVIFAGGDGWVYSFRADEGQDGKPKLLWKLDANPKTSEWILGGRGTRNNIIATPVIYDGLVYVAVGQDPEHSEGIGHLWCIDPTKRGDVSAELAVRVDDRNVTIPPRRIQSVSEEDSEIAIDNPNSAVVWHYRSFDQNGDGEIEFHEEMHRSCGTVAIKDDILYIADFSGVFHCLDAKTGVVHWSYDMFSAAWGSPLIVDGKVYIGDEEGDLAIFPHSTDGKLTVITNEDDEPAPAIAEIEMDNSVYSTPIVANGTLFIANRTHLFAISNDAGETITQTDQQPAETNVVEIVENRK